MVNMCCVKGCNNESYPGSRWSFHRFPNDKIMKEKWLEVIPGKYTKTSVICSAHFKVEDFTPFSNLYSRKRLRPEAVPSIFMLIPSQPRSRSQSRECRQVMSSPADDKKEWDDDTILSLIQAYKNFPTLWNHHSIEYKNRKLKIRTLHSLGTQFNTTAVEVRRKIHNLRCQFNAELRKIKKKSVQHNIAENLIYSEWKYFDQLNFLAEVYIERPSRQFNDTGAQNRIPLVTKFKEESSESDEDRDDCEEPPSPTTPRSNETVEICVPIENKVIKPSDEDHRIFGEYVASELRNLSHHNAKRLKMMIRKSILEVTEDEYSETSIKCELN